jgi:hypothetical protein
MGELVKFILRPALFYIHAICYLVLDRPTEIFGPWLI